MDLIHKFLNFFLPIISLIVASFFIPTFLFFKFFNSCFRSTFPEKLAGKVVIITGASSGIGEHLAYEYAKHGACLALVARRKDRLELVAGKARKLGSPDVITISANVSNLHDCKQFVDKTINHFGYLDHLVNNAGIAPLCSFEDYKCVSDHASTMDINFWGSVYSTQFALPYLKKCKGKLVVISSTGAWFSSPQLSIYNASKAALISFYNTLRTELGSDVRITIVNPGMIESEITNEEFLTKGNLKFIPLESTEGCAKAILESVRRGDRDLTEPAWMKVVWLWKSLCPEVLEYVTRLMLVAKPKTSTSHNGETRSKELSSGSPQVLSSGSTQPVGYKIL